MSDTADVIYKCTDFFAPEDDRGILWCDERIGIMWPVASPSVSDKDSRHPTLSDIPEDLLPSY